MGTSSERYAVVSCHVERPLDDRVWGALVGWLERRPGRFPVAALMRPPDVTAEEDEGAWIDRARTAAAVAPLGHHTHWTSPTHARPVEQAEPAGERVLREGRWLCANGLEPTLFCGGGWYTDATVGEACATLGYADCTPRATRPTYLDVAASWAELTAPARLRLPSGQLLTAVATTHSLGDLVRALARPRGLPHDVVHVYFHDTDLLDRRRERALAAALRLLARRRRPARLDEVAEWARREAAEVAWGAVARGGDGPPPQ